MQSPLINPLKSALINPLINPFGGGSVPTISPANFTFSRASAAYDPLGILYPSGVPRIYGTQPWQGLMVEEGTSNLLPSGSDTFSTASGWGSPDVLTITPGQSDPFGGNNAYRIQGTGLGGSTYKLYITVTGRANPHTEATSLFSSLK